MTILKISYSTNEELQRVLRLISPDLVRFKIAKDQKGKYKKAYAELEIKT